MSIKLMTFVWGLDIPHTQKIVYLALADNANDEGECYPSITTLMLKCGLSERTIQSAISDLERMGGVQRTFREGRSTIYRITPANAAPPQTPHPAYAAPTPAGNAPPPPQSTTQTPANAAPITSKKPSIESSRNRHIAKIAPPEEFNDLKSIYPKRAGDQGWADALRRCNAHLKRGTSWIEILEGAKRYADYVRAVGNEGTQYVKSAAVFCGPDKHFLSEWVLPKNKAEVIRDQNVDVSLQWLEQQEKQNATV